MSSRRRPVVDPKDNTKLNLPLRFVEVRNPDSTRDPESKRQARSHAVKHALQKKRNLQQQSGNNFRAVSSLGGSQLSQVITGPPPILSPSSNDLFGLLAIDSSRLKSLLIHDTAKQAAEPIFSIDDKVVFQTFDSVFRANLKDAALSNAVMLTLVFGETEGSINQECLGYLNRASKSIYERMGSPDKAASVAVIGAILLLAGVEARLGMRPQVQLHMSAIPQLLAVCGKNHVYLNDGIKRAIFWQDLNCSIMAGSIRLFDHTTFAELQWRRDPFCPGSYILVPGFEVRSELLHDDFITVLEDVHALQCIRDSPSFVCEDTTWMIHVDNYQASVQSRLVSLPRSSLLLECCHLAAYISACQMCCKVWRASQIPSYISLQLMDKIEEADASGTWENHPDLLIWLLYMGGAFIPKGTTRSRYIVALKQKYLSRLEDLRGPWPKLLGVLKRFIWSEKAFTAQGKEFWEENAL